MQVVNIHALMTDAISATNIFPFFLPIVSLLTEIPINFCQVWGGSLGEAHSEKICKVVYINI